MVSSNYYPLFIVAGSSIVYAGSKGYKNARELSSPFKEVTEG